jgi:hypothetical protein
MLSSVQKAIMVHTNIGIGPDVAFDSQGVDTKGHTRLEIVYAFIEAHQRGTLARAGTKEDKEKAQASDRANTKTAQADRTHGIENGVKAGLPNDVQFAVYGLTVPPLMNDRGSNRLNGALKCQ